MATQPSDAEDKYHQNHKPLSNAALLRRARDIHNIIDFKTLAAGPNAGGPWKRVEAVDRFVVFREMEASKIDSGPEVLCAGRLDAAIEEVVSILCPHSETEHNSVMTALHEKRFLFGSFERSVPCNGDATNQEELTSENNGEYLTVKTSTFARSSLFGHNEQWCYTDFFQPKSERDGFTISLSSLGQYESTPARMMRTQTRVKQLHDLTASYLVDLDPGNKGLRVVFNTKFLSQDMALSSSDHSFNQSAQQSFDASPTSPTDKQAEIKAQTRRLLMLARGVTKLPELVRSRRFGFQIPADLDAIQVSNPRCPCCTRSLTPVRMSLSVAASAISKRNLSSLKTDTRRCYLCGYLACIDCWTSERMETMTGRVATIVVCKRCQASVAACDYSDISVDRNHGPACVVEDSPVSSKVSLFIDFLAYSLAQTRVGSTERSTVISVVRTLLHESEEIEDDVARLEQDCDVEVVAKVDQFMRDESKFPHLEACKLANAERRSYVLDFPDDPKNSAPRGPIPRNEDQRLSAVISAGLLMLAEQLAPSEPRETIPDHQVDVRDLELICQLAMRTLGYSNALISVMGINHEHVLASTAANFAGAAVPRDCTMCQHQLMSQDPLVVIHPEADVRLQAIPTVKLMSLRTYIGFPVTVPLQDSLNTLDSNQIAVGTLCCFDSKPHHELTRSQHVTMQNLARTASQLVQMKGLQLRQRADPAS